MTFARSFAKASVKQLKINQENLVINVKKPCPDKFFYCHSWTIKRDVNCSIQS